MGFAAVESARKQLEALVGEGRLLKTPGCARGYRLPSAHAGPAVRVPLLGHIQAGDLQTAVEQPEGWIVVETRAAPSDLFALHVRGESMRDAGIFSGDIVVVRRQREASNGDIIVALVGDEATVKRWRRSRNQVFLEPANPEFEPIVLAARDVRVLGQVVEVRRKLDGSMK